MTKLNCHNVTTGMSEDAVLRFPLPGLSYHVCHHASSSSAARQNCCLEITISDGKWGAILELLAAITRVLTSRMKKRLRLWLTKLINLLVYANYIDIKWRVKNYRNLKKIMKSSRRNSKCASLLLDFLF